MTAPTKYKPESLEALTAQERAPGLRYFSNVVLQSASKIFNVITTNLEANKGYTLTESANGVLVTKGTAEKLVPWPNVKYGIYK